MSVLVVVPVLGRPQRVLPLARSLAASAGEVPLSLLFVASEGDVAEIGAVEALLGKGPRASLGPPCPDGLSSIGLAIAPWNPKGGGDWARKINLAYSLYDEPWIFTGADDLRFEQGWADAALACAEAAAADVVGTNDLGNPRVVRGKHSTHSLVSRRYADEKGTIDGPGAVVPEVYDHNYVDDELVLTARARGAFVFCEAARVEHLHPNWQKGEWDETYELGQRRFQADRLTFTRRRAKIAARRR